MVTVLFDKILCELFFSMQIKKQIFFSEKAKPPSPNIKWLLPPNRQKDAANRGVYRPTI